MLVRNTVILTLTIAILISAVQVLYNPQSLRINEVTTSCPSSLQSLINQASSGSTINVPACTFREAIEINKPLTLIAAPGAKILGSDIWNSWQKSGNYYVHSGLPTLKPSGGQCEEAYPLCGRTEQVFIDGTPLTFTDSTEPTATQFTVLNNGKIKIAQDPTNRTVEVTTRTSWIKISSDNVVVDGFTMKHAANNISTGAIHGVGNNIVISRNNLSFASGPAVKLEGDATNKIDANDISYNGVSGIKIGPLGTVSNNKIHHNNVYKNYRVRWAAAGIKFVGKGVIVTNNEVYENNGAGIWTDVLNDNSKITNNIVHHNTWEGIRIEISTNTLVSRNKVYSNNDAGIHIATSPYTTVKDNFTHSNRRFELIVTEQDRAAEEKQLGVHNLVFQNNTYLGITPELYKGLLASHGTGNGNRYGVQGSAFAGDPLWGSALSTTEVDLLLNPPTSPSPSSVSNTFSPSPSPSPTPSPTLHIESPKATREMAPEAQHSGSPSPSLKPSPQIETQPSISPRPSLKASPYLVASPSPINNYVPLTQPTLWEKIKLFFTNLLDHLVS